jgi:ketosteroid isomerase-like protein
VKFRALLVLPLALLAALPAFATDTFDTAAEAAKILATDKASCAAAQAQGAAGWSAFFDAEGIMFSGPPGTVRGREAIQKALAVSFAAPGFKLTWTPIRAEVSTDGRLGYTYGQYERKIDSPDGQPVGRGGTYVTVWKKQEDGSWKVLSNFGTGAEMATERKPSS